MTDSIEQLLQEIKDLKELNQDLLGLFENCHDALTILDGEGRMVFLNPAFERIMRMRREEVLGRKVGDISAERGTYPGASTKVLKTGESQTVIINTKDGRQLLSTGVPIFDRNGNICRIYCNLRDITELEQLKERIEESHALVTKHLVELNDVKHLRTMESHFVAHSGKMKEILETAYKIARVDVTVLILGESGVGKELVARILHGGSARAKTGPFVKLNCGAIPGELLESELFGYEAGAFTGAHRNGKVGYFEVADGGTLLLDEIGDLPLNLQVKILSVLQDHEVIRLGGTRPRRVSVRIVASTNQNLERMVGSGTFRQDLFYRLNVVPLSIPPLRERREDTPFLLHHYLDIYNRKYGVRVRLGAEAVDRLCAYRWPGNVRELANLVERLSGHQRRSSPHARPSSQGIPFRDQGRRRRRRGQTPQRGSGRMRTGRDKERFVALGHPGRGSTQLGHQHLDPCPAHAGIQN